RSNREGGRRDSQRPARGAATPGVGGGGEREARGRSAGPIVVKRFGEQLCVRLIAVTHERKEGTKGDGATRRAPASVATRRLSARPRAARRFPRRQGPRDISPRAARGRPDPAVKGRYRGRFAGAPHPRRRIRSRWG